MVDIKAKSWLVREVVNVVLSDEGLSVDKIYLVGSYASGRANDYSDLDFLVLIKGGKRVLTFPTWNQMMKIREMVDSKRIHCIYGVSIDAQESLRKKDPIKYAYREIDGGILDTSDRSN